MCANNILNHDLCKNYRKYQNLKLFYQTTYLLLKKYLHKYKEIRGNFRTKKTKVLKKPKSAPEKKARKKIKKYFDLNLKLFYQTTYLL